MHLWWDGSAEGAAPIPPPMAFTSDMRDWLERMSVCVIGVSGTGSIVSAGSLAISPAMTRSAARKRWRDSMTGALQTIRPREASVCVKKSIETAYVFPPQDTKLKIGDTPRIAETLGYAGSIVDLSAEDGRVVLKRGAKGRHDAGKVKLGPRAA